MTTEQRQLESQIRLNAKMQKELSATEYKQRARFKALETAQSLNPQRNIHLANEKLPDFDIVKKSEEIYQWLIKIVK